jgi:hypothetical protein
MPTSKSEFSNIDGRRTGTMATMTERKSNPDSPDGKEVYHHKLCLRELQHFKELICIFDEFDHCGL